MPLFQLTAKMLQKYYFFVTFILQKKTDNFLSATFMAPRAGLEPATYRLTAERSTN